MRVSLDDLAAGKLPDRITKAINEMELTVEEVIEWESSKPKVRLVATVNSVEIGIRVRIPMKKLAAIFASLGGASGLFWIVSHIIHP